MEFSFSFEKKSQSLLHLFGDRKHLVLGIVRVTFVDEDFGVRQEPKVGKLANDRLLVTGYGHHDPVRVDRPPAALQFDLVPRVPEVAEISLSRLKAGKLHYASDTLARDICITVKYI